MTERLLLTGAGGFIGHHTLEHVLSNTDWLVVATDSFRHGGKIDRIREVLAGHPDWAKRVSVLPHDLTAPFTPQTAQKIGHVDYIIAMASLSHVDDSLADPVPFVLNNTSVALSVLEYARACDGLRSIILVSTDEVYGPNDAEGHVEWSAIVPSNPYAASKAAQEAIAVSYWRGFGLPLIITNTMNVIGERQDPVKFLPKTIRAIRDGVTMTIHGSPGNIGSRHYLHARNAADAWLWLLRSMPPNVYGQKSRDTDRNRPGTLYRPGLPIPQLPPVTQPDRYNVCGLERVDNLELATRVASIMGAELRYDLIDFHSARPGHDPHYALDGTKLSVLGWKAPVPFDESLERTVKWTLAHAHWLLA